LHNGRETEIFSLLSYSECETNKKKKPSRWIGAKHEQLKMSGTSDTTPAVN